jgi:hypothetical protein
MIHFRIPSLPDSDSAKALMQCATVNCSDMSTHPPLAGGREVEEGDGPVNRAKGGGCVGGHDSCFRFSGRVATAPSVSPGLVSVDILKPVAQGYKRDSEVTLANPNYIALSLATRTATYGKRPDPARSELRGSIFQRV